MSKVSASFAKLAGMRRAVQASLDEEARRGQIPVQNYTVDAVGHLFTGAANELMVLRKVLPELYADFEEVPAIPQTRMAATADCDGRASDWRQVQAFIERDIGLPTLELAQDRTKV